MRTQPIQADRYWNDTGVQLKEKTRYRISVVPGAGAPLHDASFQARSIEGEDWNSLPHKAAELVHGKRVDDAKWFALVCFFNDVQLELFYKNNGGSVVLEIEELTSP